MNLAGADLNLLVTFDALLAEGSVTRAAERVELRQSAMSNVLRRLRAGPDVPGFALHMAWHSRTADDPPHRWLRAVLSEMARTL